MKAAKVMDIISRLPGCSGHAADAVSVYSQVKVEDAPTFLKIPKSECPDIWIRLPRHKWPKIMVQHGKIQSFFLSEFCTVILWQDCYGKGNFEKILLKYGCEKVPNWECLCVHRHKGLFLSVYVDDVKLAGKKQNINPMWKVLKKEVDLGEPTSFLDHVYLDVLKDNVK